MLQFVLLPSGKLLPVTDYCLQCKIHAQPSLHRICQANAHGVLIWFEIQINSPLSHSCLQSVILGIWLALGQTSITDCYVMVNSAVLHPPPSHPPTLPPNFFVPSTFTNISWYVRTWNSSKSGVLSLLTSRRKISRSCTKEWSVYIRQVFFCKI